jgi:large subunit ribosomal protein L21
MDRYGIFQLSDFGADPFSGLRMLARSHDDQGTAELSCWTRQTTKKKEGELMASSFAVIRTGGKMYRVTPGQVLVVERIEEDGPVIFDEVLMVSEDGVTSYATLEKPLAVEVHGRILRQEKDPKIIVFKKKRRKNYRRKKGHRQLVSRVKIDSIINTA